MQDDDDRDDDRVNAMVVAINAAATYHDLKAGADEFAALARATSRPLPTLPLDPAQREATLTILLLQSRDRERRYLALLAGTA
ncbi:MAG: hypothetical protein WDN50_02480 [Bradyrhizobium sp.]